LLEGKITTAVWAFGALIYTLLLRISIPIYTGRIRYNYRLKM